MNRKKLKRSKKKKNALNNLTRKNSRSRGVEGEVRGKLIESSIEAPKLRGRRLLRRSQWRLILGTSFQSSTGFKLNIVPNQSRLQR